jgi:dienelactone hydrolase
VDHIPVMWAGPQHGPDTAPAALWLPALGIDKNWVASFLEQLAGAGFVAVSFDPWQHGERGTESAEEIRQRVFGAYRRHKWPILGLTTLDALRVIDWTFETLGAGPVLVAGGISMGGEVAATLAGIDRRVAAVAAIGSSPDWSSPGMHGFDDPSTPLDQGQPDAYAQWFYDRLDPRTHLDRYARGPWMAFECGQEDFHVPADGAMRFQSALRDTHPHAAERVRVTVHPGIGHLDAMRSGELHQRCLGWFRQTTETECASAA